MCFKSEDWSLIARGKKLQEPYIFALWNYSEVLDIAHFMLHGSLESTMENWTFLFVYIQKKKHIPLNYKESKTYHYSYLGSWKAVSGEKHVWCLFTQY